MGFLHEPNGGKKKSHLEEKKKLSVFTLVGLTNFDIFTIDRKKEEEFF